MTRVLVLGGTSEGRRLAAELDARGIAVTSSLAGRVVRPRLPHGDVRIGGFGGTEGLAAWLGHNDVAAVVDATHPYATRISASAVTACAATRLPLLRLERPPWPEGPGDRWVRVPDAAAAARVVGEQGRRVLLTLGRGDLAAFAAIPDVWFLVRSVDPPGPPLPERHEILLDRGPFTVEAEDALLAEHAIDLLVTRDSGGTPTGAKLTAARRRGVRVVLLDRPAPPPAASVSTVEEATRWVVALVGDG